MKTAPILFATTLAIALCGFGGTALADANSGTPGGIVRSSLDGHPFQNGGIGDEEVADIDSHATAYNVRLTFSEGPRNAYAAGLKLRISDATGKSVFALNDAGPLTDVQLPAGHYKVAAVFDGVERTGTIDVGAKGRATLNLHWRDE